MTMVALYRHFDPDGELLYVGVSINPFTRLAQHVDGSHWSRRIARIEIEWCDRRADAELKERTAIRAERPKHNIQHACDDGLGHIASLISEWPTRKALADEIGANVASVHKWAEAGRIPSRWQASVVRAAQDRGLTHVTAEWMLGIHSEGSEAA